MITSLKGSKLSAVGAKRYIENTPNLYSGLTIQSRPCWPKADFGLVNLKKFLYPFDNSPSIFYLSDPLSWFITIALCCALFIYHICNNNSLLNMNSTAYNSNRQLHLTLNICDFEIMNFLGLRRWILRVFLKF